VTFVTYQDAGNNMLKWWPVLVVIALGIAATSVANYRITANAGEMAEQRLDLDELQNKVVVESKATSLALQELRIRQEAAIAAQEQTARQQDSKLDLIIRSLRSE